jgi:hypothetical protein
MKNYIPNFEEFLNESILNEANFLDVWPEMPYGDWKSEYDIPKSVQQELYRSLQSELGSKNVKVKEEIKDLETSPIFKELNSMNEWDAFYDWTNRSESTSIGAWKLKNGEIVVCVYQSYSRSDARTAQVWTITK